MISLEQLAAVFALGTDRGERCLEIEFFLRESEVFDRCFMGKYYDLKRRADVYWYGLTPDGNNAYDYLRFEDMVAASVFDGKSLREVWPEINIWSIDGCAPEERLAELLNM